MRDLDVVYKLFDVGLFLLNARVKAHQLKQLGKVALEVLGVTEKLITQSTQFQ